MTRRRACFLILILFLTGSGRISISGLAQAQDRASAFFNAGFQQYKDGRYAEAVESFKEVIRLRTSLPEAHYNLGISYMGLKRYPEAIAALREAIRLKPDYYDAYVSLGNALDYSAQKADAISAYQQAIGAEIASAFCAL